MAALLDVGLMLELVVLGTLLAFPSLGLWLPSLMP